MTSAVVSLRAALVDASWRVAGCGIRCRLERVTFPGRAYSEAVALHDPLHHEAYGQHVLAEGAGHLARTIVATDCLLVDSIAGVVRVAGREIRTTPLEFGVLSYLATRVGEVCTSREVLRAVWGAEYVANAPQRSLGRSRCPYDQLIKMHLHRLRAKLGPARRLLQTRRSLGYVLAKEPAA